MADTASSPYGEYFHTYAATLQRRSRLRRVLLWTTLFLVAIVLAIGGPIWWHLHQYDVRREWEKELKQYVWLHYAPTNLAYTLLRSNWVPHDVAVWYRDQTESVRMIDFTPLKGRAIPAALADRIIHSPWPYLVGLHAIDLSLWDGQRWMLPRQGSVTELRLRGIGLDDNKLAAFPLYPSLLRLDLSKNALGDRGLASIAGLSQLQDLYLEGTRITDQGLEVLESCPNLQWLHLDQTQLDGRGLVHLRGLNRLVTLTLKNTALRDEHLKRLPPLPSLRFLELNGTRLDGSGLAWDWEPVLIESLDLASHPVRPENLKHLRRFKGLKTLALSGSQINNESVEHLRALPLLEHLSLEGTGIDDAGLRRLLGEDATSSIDARPGKPSPPPALKSLTLSRTRITNAAGPLLRNVSTLTYLNVADTGVDDAFVAALAGHPGLYTLNLRNTRVTAACVPSLMAMPKLWTLDIRGTRLTEAALAPLMNRGLTLVNSSPPGTASPPPRS